MTKFRRKPDLGDVRAFKWEGLGTKIPGWLRDAAAGGCDLTYSFISYALTLRLFCRTVEVPLYHWLVCDHGLFFVMNSTDFTKNYEQA